MINNGGSNWGPKIEKKVSDGGSKMGAKRLLMNINYFWIKTLNKIINQ
jgi:hypothetical protein